MDSGKTSGAAPDSPTPQMQAASRAAWAEVCCEQARDALRHRRYRAAHGLFVTADALYQCALSEDATHAAQWSARLGALASEKAVCAELLRGSPNHAPRQVFYQEKEVSETSSATSFVSRQISSPHNDTPSSRATSTGERVLARTEKPASHNDGALCIPFEELRLFQPSQTGDKR